MAQIANETFADLVEVLEQELRIYHALAEACRQEKEALVSAQSTEIRKMTESKENLLQSARDVDFRRSQIAKNIGRSLGLQEANPRLKILIEKAPEKEALQLKALQSGLEIEVSSIKEMNEMNGRLIQAALENVRGALNSIRGTVSESPLYKKEGRMEAKTLSGQFVSREA